MFELHWITASDGRSRRRRRIFDVDLVFWKVLIFTTCYRSHSPSRVFEIVKFSVASFSPKQSHRHKTFFSSQLIWNSWANYDRAQRNSRLQCVRLFFVALMLLFMPGWWKKLEGKQVTKRLLFTVMQNIATRLQLKPRHLETPRHSFKAGVGFIKN